MNERHPPLPGIYNRQTVRFSWLEENLPAYEIVCVRERQDDWAKHGVLLRVLGLYFARFLLVEWTGPEEDKAWDDYGPLVLHEHEMGWKPKWLTGPEALALVTEWMDAPWDAVEPEVGLAAIARITAAMAAVPG